MKKIIRQILKEDRRQMFLNKIVKVMKNDFPLIKNMKDYGFYEQLSKDELNYVLSGILGAGLVNNFEIGYGFIKYTVYNINNDEIYVEFSDSNWEKREYDENGNQIYYESSNGKWVKKEYDDNGNRIYFENSDGYWEKREFDENNNKIYYEDSYGVIRDNR